MEFVLGCPALSFVLEVWSRALRKLHKLGILLGDTNKFNFLMDAGGALICDLENCVFDAGEDNLKCELDGLEKCLAESEEFDDHWTEFGQERLRNMSATDFRV